MAMTTANSRDRFYGGIPVFRGFSSLMDPALYSPLPDDWTIGVADIVESTKAIAEARYKAVNMAGAAVIAAVTNALDGREFPFVFGGDGASFAVSPDDLERARDALAATAIWVKDDLNLVMRVALIPIAAIRAQGLDVRVARFGPSGACEWAWSSHDATLDSVVTAIVQAPDGRSYAASSYGSDHGESIVALHGWSCPSLRPRPIRSTRAHRVDRLIWQSCDNQWST